jgi:hypothetical protein
LTRFLDANRYPLRSKRSVLDGNETGADPAPVFIDRLRKRSIRNARESAVVMAAMVMMAMMPVMAMTPVTVMPMMMVMPMPGPMDFGRLHLGILLHRRGGAGIGQRQRLGLFGRGGQDQQSANRSQSQKSHQVHVFFSVGIICSTPAGRLIESTRAATPIAS